MLLVEMFFFKDGSRKTLGVIWAGNIGTETIKLSKTFFNNILAYDPFKSQNQLSKIGAVKATMREVAKKSDFIVILCNLDENTRGMINKDFFKKVDNQDFAIEPIVNLIIAVNCFVLFEFMSSIFSNFAFSSIQLVK